MSEVIALFQAGRFMEVLDALGVHHVDPAILSGTMDGYIQPDIVQVMDIVWPEALSLALVIAHGSTHLYQQRYPWGGLGLEVMAAWTEYLLCFLLGVEPPPDTVNRLEGWLDAIYEDELDALGLVK